MNPTYSKLRVIDLFAGAGGFSCGLEETGVFDVVLAIEVHPQYRETYKRNHPGVPVLGDINRILESHRFDALADALRNKYGDIDVVVGGPPCQGFSKANRQRNHLISTNNLLVMSYMKFVDKLRPRAFVMENVRDMPRYGFYVSTDPWDQAALDISRVKRDRETVSLGHAGSAAAPLARFLWGFLERHSALELPFAQLLTDVYPPLHTFHNYVQRNRLRDAERFQDANKVLFGRARYMIADTIALPEFIRIPLATLFDRLAQPTVFDADSVSDLVAALTGQLAVLGKFDELHRNRVKVLALDHRDDKIVVQLETYNLADHFLGYFREKGYQVGFEVLEATRFGVPQRRERVIFLGVRTDELHGDLTFPQPLLSEDSDYYTVEDAIADLEITDPVTDTMAGPLVRHLDPQAPPLAQYLSRDGRELHNHVRTDTREVAQSRYEVLKPGQNFHDLPDELVSTYTDPGRTQRNIYRRLEYHAPSPTVTNVRKAMWVHPTVNRAISVREAARLQSFPDSYRFYGFKNSQYQQVGNAVPPMLAQAVGEAVAQMLKVRPVKTLREILDQYPRRR